MSNITTPSLAELAAVLSYNAETGVFTWVVNRRGGARAGDVAGSAKRGGYVQINVFSRFWYAHRLAWLFTTGAWPSGCIDHVDGNPSNNRIVNLRDVSAKENQQNQRRAHASNKSSGILGVSMCKRTGRWSAKISVDNKTKNLGRFDTADAAHQAYISAKRALHPGGLL